MLKRSSAAVELGENGSAIHKAESFTTATKLTPDSGIEWMRTPMLAVRVCALALSAAFATISPSRPLLRVESSRSVLCIGKANRATFCPQALQYLAVHLSGVSGLSDMMC